MKFLKYYILTVLFGLALGLTSCEIDNYEGPDGTIQGKITDHEGNPFQINHGANILRMREISWAKDDITYTANRTIKVKQDATYYNSKIFKGTYLMMPYAGAFYPYDDQYGELDEAGDRVEITSNSTITKDFSVYPYLSIEWVQKPQIDAEGFMSCSVRIHRLQKPGYKMPDLREVTWSISRTINAGAGDGQLIKSPTQLTNDMAGQEIQLVTQRALRWSGINYWVRVSASCKAVSGDPETNYPGMGASNYSTIEQIFYN